MKRKKPNKWLIFSSLAFQIALIMWVSIRLGQYLDLRQNSSENFFVLISSALGIVLIISLIYKQSKSFWE
ncbi:MAG: AtpZ/AtpI family protein [Flavobacteriaceae bacterium]